MSITRRIRAALIALTVGFTLALTPLGARARASRGRGAEGGGGGGGSHVGGRPGS